MVTGILLDVTDQLIRKRNSEYKHTHYLSGDYEYRYGGNLAFVCHNLFIVCTRQKLALFLAAVLRMIASDMNAHDVCSTRFPIGCKF